MRHLLVDTDTAADDPVALVMALRHPSVRVEAITVVAGNVPVDQGIQNALYTLELLGEHIPVLRGAEAPLLAPLKTSQFIHGEDGMGTEVYPCTGASRTLGTPLTPCSRRQIATLVRLSWSRWGH
jgi:purine nucleosidase